MHSTHPVVAETLNRKPDYLLGFKTAIFMTP